MSIQVSDLNPLRFIDTSNLNSGFDGNLASNLLNWYQTNQCFLQPFIKSDNLILQVIADVVPDDVEIRDQYDTVISTGIWSVKPLTLPDCPDLKVYELELPFVDVPEGAYQAYFNTFVSEPFRVFDQAERTILLKYKNSRNDYDTVFDTGIQFEFRTYGSIDNYVPQNDREVFTDQRHNVTQLSSVAFRRFNFVMGMIDYGMPAWMVDKYNLITQCDQVSYNNIYYQIPEDTNIEVTQNNDYSYIWEAKVDIEPVDNNFIRYITQPDGSGVQTFTPVQKVTPFYNVAGGFNLAGTFKYLSKLESVDILKSGADYLLNIGVTPGGGEIVSNWPVDESRNDIELNYLFNATQTIYFSGSGLNANAFILNWLQLDEPPVPVGGPTPPAALGKNAKMFFEEILPGDLAAVFDLSTGLGLQNGAWKDWAIAGTNGTVSMSGKLPIGWDQADSLTIGTTTGSATITIGKANLPAVGVGINVSRSTDGSWRTSGGGGRPITNVGGVGFSDPIDTGNTQNLGSGTPLPFTPLSVICVYVIKIA